MKSKTFVSQESNAPTEPHWAIFRFGSVHVPGDERSKTNPGHGYPAHSVSTVKYEAYTDEVEWRTEIGRLEARRWGHEPYFAARVIPAKVGVSVDVSVEDEDA